MRKRTKKRRWTPRREVPRNEMQRRRLGKGWSRVRLAEQTGLHETTVRQAEAGRLIPYPAQLRRIAWALGVDPDAAHTLFDPIPTVEMRDEKVSG